MFNLKQYEDLRCAIRIVKRRILRESQSRICIVCGNPFTTWRAHIKICSADCRCRARQRINRTSYYRNHAAKLARARDYHRRTRARMTPEEVSKERLKRKQSFAAKMTALNANRIITCKQCGQQKRVPNGRFEHCSAECQRSYERTRARMLNQRPEAKAKRNAKLREKNKCPELKLRRLVSRSVWRYLRKKHSCKRCSVMKKLPYTIAELKAHLASFFTKENGYTWENYGKAWVIDHVKPQSWFTFTSLDDPQFLECWGLQNLRPMCKQLNMHKHDKFAGYFEPTGQIRLAV